MRNTFLSRFTPSLMPKEVLEDIFVQRERLAARTVRSVQESALTGPPSHTLFVGPRGIGKTHLLSLVYHRLKDTEELQGRLAVAWLPEDEGGITSFLDFLLAALQALMRDDPALTPWLAPRLDALYDSASAEPEAMDLLREAVGDRSLLLLAENLDDIFAGLKDAGQKALRSFLQETRFVTLVMTSQGLFSGVSRHSSPFYGFFRVEHLASLSLTEAVDLLTKIARYEGKPDLVTFLQSPSGRARVRAVDHLVAGNPRLYVILSEFLTRDALDELVSPFLDMLDDLTPYYQAKMRSLSPQQRKIVDFLSGIQGALPVKEIARRTLIGATTAAPQLKLLRESGYVRIAYSQGRETYYELKEPLMRLCLDVKKQRGEPIKLFVEFLRLWCLPDELERRLAALPGDAPFARASLREALRLSASEENPLLAACRADYAMYVKQGDKERTKQVLEEWQAIAGPNALDLPVQPAGARSSKVNQWFRAAEGLFDSGQLEEALAAYEQCLVLDPNYAVAWCNQGVVLERLVRFEQALAAYERCLALDAKIATSWCNKGVTLFHLGRFKESLTAFEKCLVLDPKYADALYNKGLTLNKMGPPRAALAAWEQYLALDTQNADAWNNKGTAFLRLGRYEEALRAFDYAVQLQPKQAILYTNRVETLFALDRWEEGFTALHNVLPLFEDVLEDFTRATVNLIHQVLTGDMSRWPARTETFATIYATHGQALALGQALVQSIPGLRSTLFSPDARRLWVETWQAQTAGRSEFTLPLHLLDVAVRFLNSGDPPDPRVLLELQAEERSLLKPLLGVEEDEENED